MTASTPRFVYRTATSLDGFIADPDNSLDWLFAVPGDESQMAEHAAFMEKVGVVVEGSTTYEWVLNQEQLLENPAKWQEYFGELPTFVFTSRELPVPEGADVRFRSGDVGAAVQEIIAAAGDRDVWVAGGGALVAAFAAAGALDEIELSIAPVTLGAGAPLLAGRLESDRLELVSARQQGPFIAASYRVKQLAPPTQ